MVRPDVPTPTGSSPRRAGRSRRRRTCWARWSERVDDVDHGPQVAVAVAGELEADPRKFGVVVLAQLDRQGAAALDVPGRHERGEALVEHGQLLVGRLVA